MNTGRTRFKKGHPKPKNAYSFKKGDKLSEEHKKKIGLANKGHHSANEFKSGHIGYKAMLGKKLPDKTRGKIGIIIRELWKNPGYREKLVAAHKGKNTGESHPNWKGGITPEAEKSRKSSEFKLWREAIFNRDNYTCQKCGEHGGKLNAHHIFNFATHINLRFAIDNGITLCKSCHKDFHKKYGTKNNTEEQLNEFLNI